MCRRVFLVHIVPSSSFPLIFHSFRPLPLCSFTHSFSLHSLFLLLHSQLSALTPYFNEMRRSFNGSVWRKRPPPPSASNDADLATTDIRDFGRHSFAIVVGCDI